ncbi:MAG: glycoside hydrolase family 6 protein [bacterium]|nr:glycoside hydrolase family 6 protein [bacterium]MDZ4296444.1 glycoside hydrolase family 6 protein [Patescibacteria group bacterium]
MHSAVIEELLPRELVSTAAAAPVLEIWWPLEGARVSGVQPFKALIDGRALSEYQMFWQVDEGQWNWMGDSMTDWPHKEAMVDVSGWRWRGDGPYRVNFIARDHSGTIITQRTVTIFASSATPPESSGTNGSNPLAGALFYIDPHSQAKRQADAWRSTRPADAAHLEKIAYEPVAQWFGDWNGNVGVDAAAAVSAITSRGALPVFVAYNIPGRDCGGYSWGGAGSAQAYRDWIAAFAAGIGNERAVIVLEPDALAHMDCLEPAAQRERLALIEEAIALFKRNPSAAVYIDAGHSGWMTPEAMAERLGSAGIGRADGFALNVSNFVSNAENIAYGKRIVHLLGGVHFVIDTSRNGHGAASDGQWCNPRGRGLGERPTAQTGEELVDAFLWLKPPGASDGTCNGGPPAGQWWAEYALELARNAQ